MPFDNTRMEQEDNVLRILRDADVSLTPTTWIKGQATNGRGGMCLYQSLLCAAYNISAQPANASTAIGYVQNAIPKRYLRNIPSFNDSKQTTFSRVKLALKRAINTRIKEKINAS